MVAGYSFQGFSQNRTAAQIDGGTPAVKYYPNPATSVINFEFNKIYDKSYTLQVYNFMGKKVIEMPASTKINLSLTNFYRGVYIFWLTNKEGRIIESGRFQVVK